MPEIPTTIAKFLDELPPAARRALGHAASFAAGLLTALVVYYVLYRIGLPSKPFIYVTF